MPAVLLLIDLSLGMTVTGALSAETERRDFKVADTVVMYRWLIKHETHAKTKSNGTTRRTGLMLLKT